MESNIKIESAEEFKQKEYISHLFGKKNIQSINEYQIESIT